MLLAVQTGLRVSELTGLNCRDITLGTGANVRCEGKGRKQRAVPLTSPVEALMRAWLQERAGRPAEPLWPASHISDTGPYRVRPGMEEGKCQTGAGSLRMSLRMRPRMVTESSRSIAEVARDIRVNEGTLGNWVTRIPGRACG